MRVIEIEHGLILAAPTEGYIRSTGLHMSTLYNSLYAEIDPKRYGKDGGPDTLKMEIGTSFEEVLEPAIRQRIVGAERPGEYVTQHAHNCVHVRTRVVVGSAVCACGAGVIYTPDHFLFNGVFRLGEFKATWMSIAKGIQDRRFDKWWTQIKVYCHHVQTPFARLYALFMNGDYRTYTPALHCWDVEFSEREMREEWLALVRHGKRKGLIPQ